MGCLLLIDINLSLISLLTPLFSLGFNSIEKQPGLKILYIYTETPLNLKIKAAVKNCI